MNQAPPSDESVAALMAALDEVARLLEAGDSEGAAEAMAGVVGRCPTVSAETLGAEGIATARQLLGRIRQAEALLRQKVTEEIAALGTSRRAQSVYR
jgi:hypothetical protein